MTFHGTGNPVTADDFIYWFDRGPRAPNCGGLFNIDTGKIAVLGEDRDLQIKLTFSDKSPYFFYLFRDQSPGADGYAGDQGACDR